MRNVLGLLIPVENYIFLSKHLVLFGLFFKFFKIEFASKEKLQKKITKFDNIRGNYNFDHFDLKYFIINQIMKYKS